MDLNRADMHVCPLGSESLVQLMHNRLKFNTYVSFFIYGQ